MIICELKKIFGNKIIIVLFIAFLMLNVALTYYQASKTVAFNGELPKGDHKASIDSMFERYNDNSSDFIINEYQPIVAYVNNYITASQELLFQFMLQGGNPDDFRLEDHWDEYDQDKIDKYYSEYIFIAQRLNYQITYKDNIQNVIRQAQSTLKETTLFGVSVENYDYEYRSEIVDLYTVNKEIAFDIEYTRGWDSYFSYTGINLCALLFILVLVPCLLLDEKQSGTFPVVHTTKRGYIHLILSKIVALFVIVCATVLIFSATSLVIYGIKCGGFSSLSNYVQAFSKYNYCPFIIKVGEYLVVSLLVKILALFAVGVVIMLLSWIIKNHVMTDLASVVLIGANFVIYITEFLNVNHPLRLLNLFAVMDTDMCFTQYYSINCFNHSVPYLVAMLAFWGSTLIISAIVLISFFCRIGGGGHKQKKKSVSIKLPHIATPCLLRTSFGFEAHKLLIAGKCLIFIIIALLIKIGVTENYMTYQSSVSDELYKEYMFMLEGEWSQEKADYIDDERAAINAVLLVENEMEAKYAAGEIGFYDYNDYRKELYDAKVRDSIFTRVENHESYILKLRNHNTEAHFVYATGWNAMYSQTFDFILYGLLLTMMVFIFTVEFNGMLPIVRATRNGRTKIFITKYALAVSLAIVISALFAYVDFCKMIELYDFTAGSSPAQSLALWSGLPVPLSLRGIFILYECIKVAGFILLSILVVSISVITRKAIYSMAMTLLLTVVPFVLSCFGFGFAKYLDFTYLLNGSQYLVMSLDSTLYFIVFSLCTLLISWGMTVLGYKRWNDTK